MLGRFQSKFTGGSGGLHRTLVSSSITAISNKIEHPQWSVPEGIFPFRHGCLPLHRAVLETKILASVKVEAPDTFKYY